MVLTFETVDENVCCDHSNETSLVVPSQGATCFSTFYERKFRNFDE